MKAERQNPVSKNSYSFMKRIVYTLFGYPPRPAELPDETWKRWENRFQSPDYDWTNHSGSHNNPPAEK